MHAFERHPDPSFGARFGGGCAAVIDGVMCGWPRQWSGHKAARHRDRERAPRRGCRLAPLTARSARYGPLSGPPGSTPTAAAPSPAPSLT